MAGGTSIPPQPHLDFRSPNQGVKVLQKGSRPCKIDCNHTAAPATTSLQKALHPPATWLFPCETEGQ